MCADQPDVTWNNWGKGFFTTYCTGCHSETTPNRYGAPESVNFDTLDEVKALKSTIRKDVLEDGTMPVGGGVIDEHKELLEVFLDCGLGGS
jgi:uncharacterized membrane protein